MFDKVIVQCKHEEVVDLQEIGGGISYIHSNRLKGADRETYLRISGSAPIHVAGLGTMRGSERLRKHAGWTTRLLLHVICLSLDDAKKVRRLQHPVIPGRLLVNCFGYSRIGKTLLPLNSVPYLEKKHHH